MKKVAIQIPTAKTWDAVKSSFGDEKRFWPIAAAILGIVSFLKGLRHPSSWAASQSLVNYDHGLIKRGFFGAAMGRPLHLASYVNFTIFSYLCLYILLRLMMRLVATSEIFKRVGNGEVAALFYSSIVVSFLGVLAGYLDIFLAIITVSLLLIRNLRIRLMVAVPVCTIGVLVHEMFLAAFLPVILFSFLFDAISYGDTGMRRTIWWLACILAAACFLLTSMLAWKVPVSAPTAHRLYREAAERADFWVDPNVFATLTRSAADNLLEMVRGYTEQGEWRREFLASMAIFTPLMWILAAVIVRAIRLSVEPALKKVALFAAMMAFFSPIVLNALGSDCSRWDATCCLDGFLVLLLISRAMPNKRLEFGGAYRNLIIILIALNMATGEFMMGMAPNAPGANHYPFSDEATQLYFELQSRTWVPPPYR